jgi:hypothetical protein
MSSTTVILPRDAAGGAGSEAGVAARPRAAFTGRPQLPQNRNSGSSFAPQSMQKACTASPPVIVSSETTFAQPYEAGGLFARREFAGAGFRKRLHCEKLRPVRPGAVGT